MFNVRFVRELKWIRKILLLENEFFFGNIVKKNK